MGAKQHQPRVPTMGLARGTRRQEEPARPWEGLPLPPALGSAVARAEGRRPPQHSLQAWRAGTPLPVGLLSAPHPLAASVPGALSSDGRHLPNTENASRCVFVALTDLPCFILIAPLRSACGYPLGQARKRRVRERTSLPGSHSQHHPSAAFRTRLRSRHSQQRLLLLLPWPLDSPGSQTSQGGPVPVAAPAGQAEASGVGGQRPGRRCLRSQVCTGFPGAPQPH